MDYPAAIDLLEDGLYPVAQWIPVRSSAMLDGQTEGDLLMASSIPDTQSRLQHLYQKLQNYIQDEDVINEVMVDIKTLISQAVTERTIHNRQADHVSQVYGNAWWDNH